MKKICAILFVIILVSVVTIPAFSAQTFNKFPVDDWSYKVMMMLLR